MNTQPSVPSIPPSPIARAVMAGLVRRPRRLPTWLMFDSEGAALYERITGLDEYHLTRLERAIFELHGDAILDAAAGPDGRTSSDRRARSALRPTIIELAAGTAKKTDLLLRHWTDALYMPMDVDPWSLAVAKKRLGRALPELDVLPFAGSMDDALSAIALVPASPKIVMLLGSSLGNHDDREAVQLLRAIGTAAGEGAALVLGTDLVKSPGLLLPAYDDRLGVNERFNKNVLARINRELGARFDTDHFDHVAIWDVERSAVEMHLRSLDAQTVPVRGLGLELRFDEGELIHTKTSVKYDLARVGRLLTSAGFARERTFLDPSNFYAVHVARVVRDTRRLLS